jgi:hypothetical protein
MVPCSPLPQASRSAGVSRPWSAELRTMCVNGSLIRSSTLPVEFGVGAVHLQFDLLAEFAGEVADDARQLLPGIADRLHPRLHDAFLQLGGDVGQPLQAAP